MAHERRIFLDLSASNLNLEPCASHNNQSLSGSVTVTASPSIPLSESQSHHLFSVLRLREGDPLVVVDRYSPRQFEARIESVQGRRKGERGAVSLIAEIPIKAEPSKGALLFPLCKPKATELVCEKATELNISQILFWQADRSVIKVGGDSDRMDRQQRLTIIAESAACQSGRVSIPMVRVVSSLDAALELVAGCSNKLFGHLGEGAEALSELDLTGTLTDTLSASPDTLIAAAPNGNAPIAGPAMAVGPEGDFTDRELALLLASSFKPVTLGPNRLRSETAAIVMLSWLASAA